MILIWEHSTWLTKTNWGRQSIVSDADLLAVHGANFFSLFFNFLFPHLFDPRLVSMVCFDGLVVRFSGIKKLCHLTWNRFCTIWFGFFIFWEVKIQGTIIDKWEQISPWRKKKWNNPRGEEKKKTKKKIKRSETSHWCHHMEKHSSRTASNERYTSEDQEILFF